MTEQDPTGPTLDEEGIPDLEGPLPEKAATGDPQEGVPVPSTRPASFDWGVTEAEQRAGEPVDVRVEREQPDFGAGGPGDGPRESGFVLVDEADEAPGLVDTEKDAVARAVGEPDLGIGPEDAALHVVDAPSGDEESAA
jgi:hypothetical protein